MERAKPHFSGPCPACGGTGWVLKGPDGGNGGAATRPVGATGAVARRCACWFERVNESLKTQANIPKRYENCSLKNFEPHNESHKDALKTAQALVRNFPDQDVGLLLIGPCGVGKTHLAVAILRELMAEKNASCVFYDFRDLIREIQSTFGPDSNSSESEVLAPVFRSEVVVLDELGAKRTTAWVEETVFYIINHRYNNKKLTIFTSNYPDTEDAEEDRRDSFYKKGGETLVERIGVRLRSRVYEMCKIVPIHGPDLRIVAKQAGYHSGKF